jgi:predicted nucleic acid-binding protein
VKSYIIDASVVTKCFIIDDYSDKAAEAINSHAEGFLSFLALSLIVYELGNVF